MGGGIAFLIMAGLLFFTQCKKDDLEEQAITNTNSTNTSSLKSFQLPNMPDIAECLTFASDTNGILRFSSTSTLESCIACLEALEEAYYEAVMLSFSEVDTNELAAILDSLGFDDLLTYKAFEGYFGHNSLRMKIESDFDEFLDGLVIDTVEGFSLEGAPSHFIGDYPFQTILTDDGKFILEDTIYWIHSDGSYYRILALDFDLLSALELNEEDENNELIEFYDGDSGEKGAARECRSWRKTSEIPMQGCVEVGPAWMTIQTGFYNFWPASVFWAETKSYLLENGKLRRTSHLKLARATGWNRRRSGGSCNDPQTYFEEKWRRSKHVQARETYFGTRRWAISGDVMGVHHNYLCPTIGYKTSVVTW